MRIQVIITKSKTATLINLPMATLLQEYIQKQEGMELTSQNPDIIHVFGTWETATSKIMTKFFKRNIPIIFTSLDGLQAIVRKPSGIPNPIHTVNRKHIITNSTSIHVCGPLEKELTSRLCPEKNIITILNPTLTRMTTPQDMFNAMSEVYKDTISSHDRQIRESIDEHVKNVSGDDTVINSICSQILYIQYLLQRGGIHQYVLDSLSNDMTEHQYDEDTMSGIIDKLKIRHFTSSLLTVLNRKSTLTEGFMPINATDDKLASCITKNIVSY